ncbi:hypothetical protein N7532_012138 [Penicillium argentinense]|uniref:Uncharacterized protein n=1 Tax=Penicillium argentinense TaxID=1131581 RepID=A0A9W9EJW7_9EURO|nr:uncharacterized protein N7532_012138 [Penicillium argentinense]KAJ5083095.1 hypothetical protein N7532_012138 [Penicillium argentinense]
MNGNLSNGDQQASVRLSELANLRRSVPSDEQQFEDTSMGMLTALADKQRAKSNDTIQPFSGTADELRLKKKKKKKKKKKNLFSFKAPVGCNPCNPQHIFDIGIGHGSWASDVAVVYPQDNIQTQTLLFVALTCFRPCFLGTTKLYLRSERYLTGFDLGSTFDLIHMRILDAAFTQEERGNWISNAMSAPFISFIVFVHMVDAKLDWLRSLHPGGWFGQLQLSPMFFSDDDSLPAGGLRQQRLRVLISAANWIFIINATST